MTCVLQPGLTIDGKPVYACGRLTTSTVEPGSDDGHGQPSSERSASRRITMDALDVSDLGLSMADLETPIPFDGLDSSGTESTSRTANDRGCEFVESAQRVEATLTISGLRGQPAGALALDLTSNTATITAFGITVWSCVLRGAIIPEASTFEMLTDGENPMQPLVRLMVQKQPMQARWGGLIESIGEDSIL